MRKYIWLVVAAALAVSLSFGVATATAGNGTSTTQFKAAYNDSVADQTCSGVHLVKKSGEVSDSETCIATGAGTSGFVAGTYTSSVIVDGCGAISPSPPGYEGFGQYDFWYSDYDGRCALSWSVTFTPNADGSWTLTIKAYY
jgi:hypothetical protein